MKYLIYCRKSTESEDRQVLSLDSQETELLRIAKENNLEILDILKESKSAKTEGRPVFNKMMSLISKGKVQGILCWKLDRLARNFIDGGKIIDLLQRGVIKEIRTHENICLPQDNVLMLAVHFGMANQYVRDLSENVKRGNRAKLEKGGWPSFAPIGYINDKVNKTLKVDRKIAPYILRTYELYSTGGYSVQQISDILYKEGWRSKAGKKMYKSHIYRILSSKFYIGLMERNGKTYQGNHAPIISVDLYNKVQEIFNKNSHPHYRKNFYSARGFLTCALCGCAITCDTKKGHQYYYCTNGKGECLSHKKYLRSEKIDEIVSQSLRKLQFDEEFIEISAEAYKQKNEGKMSFTDNAKENILKGLESLVEKESMLADGLISKSIRKEIYDLKMRDVESQRAILNQQLREIEKKGGQSPATFEQVKNVFLDGNRAAKKYLEVKDEEKRKMLEKLLSNLCIENENIVDYQFKSPYNLLAESEKIIDFQTLSAQKDSNLRPFA